MTRLIEEKGPAIRLAAALLTILLVMSLIAIGTGSGVEAYTASQRSSLKASDIQVSRERLLKSAAAHIKRGQALGYGYSQVMTGTSYVPLASFTDGFCCVDLVTHVVYTATASMINNRYHSIDQTLATAHAFSASNGLVFDTRAVSTLRSQLTAIPALYQSLGNNVNPSSLQLGDIVLTGNRDDSSANHCVFVIGKVTAAENAFMQIPSFNANTSYFLNMSSSSTRASYQSASRFNTYWDASDPNKGFYIKQVYRPLYDIKGQDLGGFALKKTDASSGAGLTGAVFLLTGPDGFSQEFTMTSSEYQSGKVYKPGSYTLKEITPPHGYLLDSTSRSLTIGFDEINQTYHTSPIKNTADKGKVKIIKKDANSGSTIKGAVFDFSQSASFPSNATYRLTTGADGSVTSQDLILGQGTTVYVREHSVPSPYLLDSSVKQIALKRGQTVTLNVQNARAQGRIEITKEGQDKTKIKGVTFSVKNASGTTVATLTTGSDGKATTSALPLGRYTVTETGVPAPYLLNSTPKTVDLSYKN
ncbi:MAG: hypothetical protein GX809_01375, partial [Clostridiaceae bacterium]|nr:hypothetical protein [Clostridiaceae bacterium]